VSLWPQLQATGLPLGSPAVASGAATPGSWLDQFMSAVQSGNLRVDFIALHWFGATFDAATAVSQLQQYISDVYSRYQRPIWLTQVVSRSPEVSLLWDFVPVEEACCRLATHS
jgi:hypothetical protein